MKAYITRARIDYLITTVAFVWSAWLGWQLIDMLMFTALVYLVLNPLSLLGFARGAVLSAILAGVLFLIHREVWASQLAVIAYYFMIAALLAGWQEGRAKGSLSG